MTWWPTIRVIVAGRFVQFHPVDGAVWGRAYNARFRDTLNWWWPA